MRALGVLLLIVTSVAALTALAFGVMTAGTFHERYAHHTRERERASEYLKSSHCRRGSSSRSKLGDFQLCDKSERILAGSPLWFSILDVSHTLPPVLATVADSARQDIFRVVCTLGGLGLLWSWVRKYTGAQAQQWAHGLDNGMGTGGPMNGGVAVIHEEDPMWGYKAGSLPRWQARRRRLSNF